MMIGVEQNLRSAKSPNSRDFPLCCVSLPTFFLIRLLGGLFRFRWKQTGESFDAIGLFTSMEAAIFIQIRLVQTLTVVVKCHSMKVY